MNRYQLKQLFSNTYFFPVLIGIWALLNILFGEKLPVNHGLGWDGYRYASLAQYLFSSPELDDYLALRIFPSLLIHVTFNLFDVSFSPANIIRGFEVINFLSLVISAFAIKRIFVHFNISLKNQLLGFTLIFLNFALSKFIFFYPAMTDTLAFCLGTLLLYFYIKGEIINIALISIIGAFSWPVIFAQGLIFICFPIKTNQHEPLSKNKRFAISLLSVCYALFMIAYFVLYKKCDTTTPYTLRINYNLFLLSIAGILMMYYFFPQVIFNNNFFKPAYLLKQISIKGLLIALVAIIIFFGLKFFMNVTAKSSYLTANNFLKISVLLGLTRPFISLISHITYYGAVVILLIIFWKSFSEQVSNFGLGLSLAIALNLYLNTAGTESRGLINIFSWLSILLVVAINQYRFSHLFYGTIFILNLVVSKIWLVINYKDSVINEKGEIGFPAQNFFMNIGPWMSHEMWVIQGIATFIIWGIIFLSTHKIDLKELKINSKYK